jgi:hypothetical protein
VGEPEKLTAPVPPPTVREFVELIDTEVVLAPILICRVRQEKAPSTVIVVPLAMITASDDVGTIPPTQEPPALQFRAPVLLVMAPSAREAEMSVIAVRKKTVDFFIDTPRGNGIGRSETVAVSSFSI